MKRFISDMDGCLLNTADAFAQLWSDILGVEIVAKDLTSWNHSWALGIDPKLNGEFWSQIWDIPASPYPEAENFIKTVKALGYQFIILTSRPSEASVKALYRDLDPLIPLIDDIYVCNQHQKGDLKSDFINRMDNPKYFLDDHIKNVVDAKLRSTDLREVFLIDRPWNQSKDVVRYQRITSYDDMIVQLIKDHSLE
jgi:hypothetical protein